MQQPRTQMILLPDGKTISVEIWQEADLQKSGSWEEIVLKTFPSFTQMGMINEEGKVWEPITESKYGFLYASMNDFEISSGAGMELITDEEIRSPLFFWQMEPKIVKELISEGKHRVIPIESISHATLLFEDGKVLEYDEHWFRGTLFYNLKDYQQYVKAFYETDFIVPIMYLEKPE